MIQRWAEGAEPLPGINHQPRRFAEPGVYGLAEPSRGKPSWLVATGASGWCGEATRTLPDVDLATESIVQHKAVIGYQQLEGKGAGISQLGQVHLSSGVRDLGESGQCCVTLLPAVQSSDLGQGTAPLQYRSHPPTQAEQQTRGRGRTDS